MSFRVNKSAASDGKRFLSFFWLAVLLGVGAGFAQQEQRIAKDLMEQARFESGAPGISLAVSIDGRIIFSEGVGFADLENKVPAAGSTVYRIASISKPISAIAIMQLLERGLIKLDDPIQKYVPSFPEKPEGAIKLLHLLTHTSGIRHYKGGEFLMMTHFTTLEDAIGVFKDDPLKFAPGSEYSYTTYGFNLLQGVIEVAGASLKESRDGEAKQEKINYGEYMQRYVWEPAGMFTTYPEYSQQLVLNRASGYMRNRQVRILNVPYTDLSVKYVGGGLISTVEDLVRVFVALDNGTLLKPATVKEMYKIHYRQGDKSGRGLGWVVNVDRKGRQRISHGGSASGFRSTLINYPKQKLVVASMSNGNWYSPSRLAQRVADIYLTMLKSENR